MENENQKIETGNKGVFPGNNEPPHPPIQNQPQQQHQPHQNQYTTDQGVNQKVSESANQDAHPDSNTYMNLKCKNQEGQVSGVLDIDLISFRERGQESRYLSISAFGADQEGQQSEARIYINNEEDFNRFKKFISNLNWND